MRHAQATMMLAVALHAAGICSVAWAQQPGVTVTRKESLTGTVQSVNLGSREVLLRDASGQPVTVVAGPEARNLAQLRPGDRVAIEYQEAVAMEMARPSEPRPPAEILSGGERTPEGARPGGNIGQLIRVRVRIDAVDAATGHVTFTGPAGGRRTVAVQDPQVMQFVQNLRPGEQVDIAYSEALAVRVEPAR